METSPIPTHRLNVPNLAMPKLISGNIFGFACYAGREVFEMHNAPAMKNRTAGIKSINTPDITPTIINTTDVSIISIPAPRDDLLLQRKHAIMLISGTPISTATRYHAWLTCPFVIPDKTPAHIEAQRTPGNDNTNAITPSTMGAPVLGFLIITSSLILVFPFCCPVRFHFARIGLVLVPCAT